MTKGKSGGVGSGKERVHNTKETRGMKNGKSVVAAQGKVLLCC